MRLPARQADTALAQLRAAQPPALLREVVQEFRAPAPPPEADEISLYQGVLTELWLGARWRRKASIAPLNRSRAPTAKR